MLKITKSSRGRYISQGESSELKKIKPIRKSIKLEMVSMSTNLVENQHSIS